MRKRTACFTGHKKIKEENINDIKKWIRETIIDLYTNKNVKHYISGMALGLDIIASLVVVELKEIYKDMTLEVAIPYEEQASMWSVVDRELYFTIIEKCDKEIMLSTVYYKGCELDRNRYMVKNSDYVIAVWNGDDISGAGMTVNFARKNRKQVIRYSGSI